MHKLAALCTILLYVVIHKRHGFTVSTICILLLCVCVCLCTKLSRVHIRGPTLWAALELLPTFLSVI